MLKDSNKGQQGRNTGKGNVRTGDVEGSGDPSPESSRNKEGLDSGWEGPDVMGAPQDPRDAELRELGIRKGAVGNEHWRDDLGLDMVSNRHDPRRANDARGHNPGWRGSAFRGRGSLRGFGRPPLGGGRGNAAPSNYLSTNQFYILMENGEFDADDCGENETSEMDIQPSTGAITSTQQGDGGVGGQGLVIQGEPHSAPGMSLLC